jgi:hypothetical protein
MENTLLNAERLTNWLRKQDPGEEYIWSDPVFCLMGRYLADNGSAWGEMQYSNMPHYTEIAAEKPWTFGAALERAEALTLPAPALQLEDKREKIAA